MSDFLCYSIMALVVYVAINLIYGAISLIFDIIEAMIKWCRR